MGSKVKCSLSVIESIAKSSAPTIICNLSKRYLNNVSELSNETISLNLILAQNLLKIQVDVSSVLQRWHKVLICLSDT